jgi:hypothetical protein
MARKTEKRKKVCLFQRFFHPSLSTFPLFPTFSAFANLYVGRTSLLWFPLQHVFTALVPFTTCVYFILLLAKFCFAHFAGEVDVRPFFFGQGVHGRRRSPAGRLAL